MFRITLTSVIVLLSLSALAVGQEPPPYLVGVSVQLDPLTTASARGVVVGRTVVVTAKHVIKGGRDDASSRIPMIHFSNDRKVKATAIIREWDDRDLAIVRVDVPADIEPVAVAAELGEKHHYWNLEKARVDLRHSISQKRTHVFDAKPRPGESGGPVLSDGKLVGVVEGGWFWLEEKPYTWPLRIARADVVVEYLK